jgi:hypothetical protein
MNRAACDVHARGHVKLVILALILLGLSTTRAEAGACLDDSEFDELVRLLEKQARTGSGDLGYLDNCFHEATHGEFATPKRLARINAACTTILTTTPSDRSCIELAALQGKTEMGGVKLFEAVSAWGSTPWSGRADLYLLQRIADARAVPLVVERWKTFDVEATKRLKKKRGNTAQWWSSWRQDAARVLGALGTADQIPFLEEQAKATKDRYVKKACTDAITAITKRATP